ncbi:MAG: hypothetical protein EPO68_03150 [Planctomycetota bacterium]|nr:MAG: hypothetical protein EPO68_03150 [Planctomycetota bacterium]
MPLRALLLFVLLLPAVLLPTGVRAWLCECRGPLAGISAQSCCDEADGGARDGAEPIATAEHDDCACCERVELPRSTTPTVKAEPAPEVPSLAHAPTAVAFELVHAPTPRGLDAALRPSRRAAPPRAAIPLRL